MVDILAPENDKKRLMVLLVVLVVVIVLSLVYKNVFLLGVKTPVVQNGDNLQNITQVIDPARGTPGGEVSITQDFADVQKKIDEQKTTLPQPPAPPTVEDLKKMSDDVTKKGTQATVPGKPVSQ